MLLLLIVQVLFVFLCLELLFHSFIYHICRYMSFALLVSLRISDTELL